jgi:hypothetical protein
MGNHYLLSLTRVYFATVQCNMTLQETAFVTQLVRNLPAHSRARGVGCNPTVRPVRLKPLL